MAKRVISVYKNGVEYKVGGMDYTAGNGISINGKVISCTLDSTVFEVVASLPTENIKSHIYLVKDTASTASNNQYIEWVYTNDSWEMLGKFKADVDLSDYYNKAEVDGLLSNKVTVESGKSLMSDADKIIWDTASAEVPKLESKFMTQAEYNSLSAKNSETDYWIYTEE